MTSISMPTFAVVREESRVGLADLSVVGESEFGVIGSLRPFISRGQHFLSLAIHRKHRRGDDKLKVHYC